jgi:hypothetical protein
MKRKSKALVTWLVLTIFTLAVYVVADLDTAWKRLLPAILVGITWNLYAYAVDRGMWPRQFVELDGHGKGHPMAREVVFWVSAAAYLLLLFMIVFAR